VSFAGIWGNRQLIQQLAAEVAARPYHAYLLIGPAGIGKALVARALTHSVLCERSPGQNFCCSVERCPARRFGTDAASARALASTPRCECCSACVQIATGVHPDLVYVERAPKRTEVLIEQVREFIEKLAVRPSRSARRIGIINDAESLNLPAQNALLKTLEEPPTHTVIFLVSNSERALLDTIRSRTRPVRFARLEPAEIQAVLRAQVPLSEEKKGAVARLARGSVSRALALAEGVDPPILELLKALSQAASMDFIQTHSLAQQFFSTRDEAADNFELIARMLEEMLCFRLLNGEVNAPSPEVAGIMTGFAQAVDTATMGTLLQRALEAHTAVNEMANPRLQAENWWMAAAALLRGA
jgi:DNA polymerase-3 subunit delta'